MDELKYINATDIKVDSGLVKVVNFKSKSSSYICGIVGIGLLIVNNLYARLLGLFFIAMAVFAYKVVEDYKVMEIYETGFIVYEDKQATKGCFVNYDLVKDWEISQEQSNNKLTVNLNDGSQIVRVSFMMPKAFNYLNKYMPTKEKNYILIRQASDKMPDLLSGVKKKFHKK